MISTLYHGVRRLPVCFSRGIKFSTGSSPPKLTLVEEGTHVSRKPLDPPTIVEYDKVVVGFDASEDGFACRRRGETRCLLSQTTSRT